MEPPLTATVRCVNAKPRRERSRLVEDEATYSLELVRSTVSPSGSLLIHYSVIAGE